MPAFPTPLLSDGGHSATDSRPTMPFCLVPLEAAYSLAVPRHLGVCPQLNANLHVLVPFVSVVGLATLVLHLQFGYLHGMQTTEKVEESICVKLAALIRLQNLSVFTHTLNIGERGYLASAINEEKHQLGRVNCPLNHTSNGSEPKLVKQSMAVSWLSASSYPEFLRVDFEAATDEFSDLFDTTRPPAERLYHMIKEASFIAALLRARLIKSSSMTWSDPAARSQSGEYAILATL